MRALIIIFVLITSVVGNAQDFKTLRFGGFIDTYHALRISEPNDFMASRSRFRGEIEKVGGRSYFFASINATHNSIMPELTTIQFREAFMEYTGNNWGFKVGRQIIIWGKADGLKITDVISPMDLTEFLAQDYDDIRIPVTGIIISKFGKNWALDLVCIPLFEGYILPGANNPWGINYSDFNIVEDPAVEPEFNFSNIEYGGKLSFYLSGIDFDIMALNTWNKAPVYQYYINDSTNVMHIRPEHHRLGFIGMGFSKSLNAFIIRGESAFFFNKKFTQSPVFYESGLLQSNSVNYLIGVDRYPGNEWVITGQFADEYILDYLDNSTFEQHNPIATLSISKKVINSTLLLSTFGYVDFNTGDFFNRASADYSISDNIHVMAGYDWFNGDGNVFGRYQQNSQVWLKAKFSF